MSNVSAMCSVHTMPLHHNRLKGIGIIKALDSDGNKSLSIEETKLSEDKFTSIDKNNNGLITKKEMNNHFHLQAVQNQIDFMKGVINTYDTNDDSLLSADELGAPENIFSSVDRNDDGQAGVRELIANKSLVHDMLAIYQTPLDPGEPTSDGAEPKQNVDISA